MAFDFISKADKYIIEYSSGVKNSAEICVENMQVNSVKYALTYQDKYQNIQQNIKN